MSIFGFEEANKPAGMALCDCLVVQIMSCSSCFSGHLRAFRVLCPGDLVLCLCADLLANEFGLYFSQAGSWYHHDGFK